jgi:hypothetical protein
LCFLREYRENLYNRHVQVVCQFVLNRYESVFLSAYFGSPVSHAGAPGWPPQSDVQQPAASPSQTGRGMSWRDVELLRKDIPSKKKRMIAANLKLTEAEATKFWPSYDQYTQEGIGINDKSYDLISDILETWGSITDDQAMIWQAKLVGPGYSNYAVAFQVCRDRARGAAGQKGRHFFSTGSPHQHDDRWQISSQLPLVQSQE